MSEMVERVARALCLEHPGIDWDDEVHLPHEDRPGTYTRPFFRRLAIAAIATMREPTADMLCAPCRDEDESWADQWRAMIDEALK